MRKLAIAIDGPAGAGKSSIAKILANRLSYLYVDTGAMYRAITLLALERNIIDDKNSIIEMLKDIHLEMHPTEKAFQLLINGEDVTEKLRSLSVSSNVSKVATIKEVRSFLVVMQRKLAERGGVIVDGRDIGSVVLPNADIKFYLTASVAVRAHRRWIEMKEKGQSVSYEEVEKNVVERDYIDSHREESPLVQVEDALLIDSSHLTFQETIETMLKIIEEKLNHEVI